MRENYLKFDKNIPSRMYEAVVTLKHIESSQMEYAHSKLITPFMPPQISPEKMKEYKDEEKRKRTLQPSFTFNELGEKIPSDGLITRLMKTSSIEKRWRVKDMESKLKEFNDEKKRKE